MPLERMLQLDELEVCVFEWGDPDNPPVLMLHATGFHGRCWDQVASALESGYRVICPDMRGHGRSAKVPPFEWRSFAGDVQQILTQLDLEGVIGVGHSVGGHCLTQVAAREVHRFERLILVDPVIFPPEFYELGHSTHGGPGASVEDMPVSRRRNQWRDWQEMVQHFAERLPFARWHPGVLEDYCRYGLLPAADGGFELACPPTVEASVYLGNTLTNVHENIDSVDLPVLVMRGRQSERVDDGRMDFSNSPTWAGLADAFAQGRDLYLEHMSHFIPMEDPNIIVRAVNGEL